MVWGLLASPARFRAGVIVTSSINPICYWLLRSYLLFAQRRGGSRTNNPPQCLMALAPSQEGNWLPVFVLKYRCALHHKAPGIQNTARIVLLADLLHQRPVLEVIPPDIDSAFKDAGADSTITVPLEGLSVVRRF